MGNVIALALLLVLAGCQHVNGSGYCDVAKPIRLSRATVAVMSDAEVAAVLSHDRVGQKLCGWAP